jgi:hypothetical protein
VVTNKADHAPLPGYEVRAVGSAGDARNEAHRLARGRSSLVGSFVLVYPAAITPSADEPAVTLEVRNSFGRLVFASAPLRGAARFAEQKLEVTETAKDRRPVRQIADGPLAGRVEGRASALAALSKAGITTTAELRAADPKALAAKTKLSADTLAAVHLQAEIPGLDAATADALVTKAEIRSRDALATTRVEALVRKLDGVVAEPSRAAGWVAKARGVAPAQEANVFDAAAVRRESQPFANAVSASSPNAIIVDPTSLLAPQQQSDALATAVALMDDAGVHDLEALGTYSVRAPQVIRPGYYLPRPTLSVANVANVGTAAVQAAQRLENALVQRGRQRFKRVEVQPTALHFVQNPVTQAVIIGEVVEFVENGELLLANEVSSLVIITDTLRANVVRRIRYEDQDLAPEPRPNPVPLRPALGQPDFDPYRYAPGDGDRGANGGNGTDGADGARGIPGDDIGPAPSVTLYVKSTPRGLPAIDLAGRPGGKGGRGQDGGSGGSGARGRPGESVVLVCTRSVGYGGNAGDGGDAGNGGKGGRGATGGSLTVYTLLDNMSALAEGGVVTLEGGAGGSGGQAGNPGLPGTPGFAGDPRGVCSEKLERMGNIGSPGTYGVDGADGAPGAAGSLFQTPISEEEWLAAFTRPWIVRLEPWEAVPGAVVRLEAENFTEDTDVLFGGSLLQGANVVGMNVTNGTFDFKVPGGADGQKTLQLRVPDGNGGYVYSETVSLRILPRLDSVTPEEVVPGMELTLEGAGFATGALFVVGNHRLPLYGTDLVRLPPRDEIDLPLGENLAHVLNPDARVSESRTIVLSLKVVVRAKAWRVKAEGGGKETSRSADDIRELFEEHPSPNTTFGLHGIEIRLDPAIGTLTLPKDTAKHFPYKDDNDSRSLTAEEQAAQDLLFGKRADGTFATFDETAVNVYFVNDIEGSPLGFGSPAGHIVMKDKTFGRTRKTDALILSHEFGHVFGLDHVCDAEDKVSEFARECTAEFKDTDPRYLMYPEAGAWIREGDQLTPDQSRRAFDNAAEWHDPK